jgi:hypothetical protein
VHVGAVDANLGGREVEDRAGVITRIGKLLAHVSEGTSNQPGRRGVRGPWPAAVVLI